MIQTPKIIVLIDKADLNDLRWDNEDYFTIKRTADCSVNPNYIVVELETNDVEFDVSYFEAIDYVLAVHEEYTNGILILDSNLEDVNGIFPWATGGNYLMAELLTETEKMYILLAYLTTKNKVRPNIDDIDIIGEKEVHCSLVDNIDKLFGENDVRYFSYKDEVITPLWIEMSASIKGLDYMIMIVSTDEDCKDDPYKRYSEYESDVWEDYYDEVYGYERYERYDF